MNNPEIVQTIEHSKDAVGMITANALHNQLGTLSPADWKEASVIYSQNSAPKDGFYINDDANGNVTIHNDLKKAHYYADNSVGQLTLNNGKQILAGAATLEGIMTVSGAFTGAALGWVEGATVATVAGAGLAGLGTAALWTAPVVGIGAAAVMAKDALVNYDRQATAQNEILASQYLFLHT